MSKIYDIAFRMGVLFNILLWTFLNLINFFEARNSFLEWENAIGASYLGEFNWGVPFPMFMNTYYLVLNTIVYVACGFFFGFLFKFVWSKISQRRAELK